MINWATDLHLWMFRTRRFPI